MDDQLVSFYRQYLQQILPTNIRYPSSKTLSLLYIQHQLYKHFFDAQSDAHLPPPDYQRGVLKRVISEIEHELDRSNYDDNEQGIFDELMSCMGALSMVPQQPKAESVQSLRTLSYFIPDSTNGNSHQKRVLIRESPNLLAAGSNVGLRTWEACLHLAYYLSTYTALQARHKNGKSITNANVVELGAGTGLLSLICAHNLGARQVLATDGLFHVVEGIRSNIEVNANLSDHKTSSNITTDVLDWTDLSNLDRILKKSVDKLEYDYILGADITYHPDLLDPLANTIKLLKTKFPKARTLIAATLRNEATLLKFRQVCSDTYGMVIRDVLPDEWKCPDFKDQTGLFHEQAFPITIMDIDLY